MSPDEAIAAIRAHTALTDADAADLLMVSDGTRALLLAAYITAEKPEDVNGWERLAKLLLAAGQFIQLAQGILGVVGAVKGLVA